MAFPIITSLVAGCGSRPSITCTVSLRRRCNPSGVTPRNPTLAVPFPSARCSWKTTKSSGDATAFPPCAATAGSAENTLAASRGSKLVSSTVDPFRRRIALRGDPVALRVSSTPAASMSTAAKTNTTRLRPAAVATAEKRRRRIDRTL